MKEQVAIRLYERPPTGEPAYTSHYRAADDVVGWDYAAGDQIGLHERDGGFLMGLIDSVEPEVLEDATGRYKVAVLWTQD